MPPETEADEAPALHCSRCRAGVAATEHTRTGWRVGYYLLHTGRTEEAAVRRGEDETPRTYRRLVAPMEMVACPACLATPDVRRVWLAFGDEP